MESACAGEKITLIVPPELAYGDSPSDKVIYCDSPSDKVIYRTVVKIRMIK